MFWFWYIGRYEAGPHCKSVPFTVNPVYERGKPQTELHFCLAWWPLVFVSDMIHFTVRQSSIMSVTKIIATTELALFWRRVTILGFIYIYGQSIFKITLPLLNVYGKYSTGVYGIQIMNVYEFNGAIIFMSWKIEHSIQRGEATLLDFTHAHLHRCMYLFSVQVQFSTLHAPVHVSFNHLFYDVSQCTQHCDTN